MKHSIEHIGAALQKARIEKGLSQRALGDSIGMPQSHISKIESGLVDLKTSTLIELSRILDLEPMLIPRMLVRTVYALEQKGKANEQRPMYRLNEEEDEE